MKPLYFQQFSSPFGKLFIYADQQALKAVVFKPWQNLQAENAIEASNTIIEKCYQQLTEYFEGKRREFDLPLSASGTTFQQQVWRTLTQIPFGKAWSYGELAQAIGNKNASRAVGAANGKNPISIIVPCHRVIGANGALTGYAGGLTAKQWLLKHEGII
ncbi:MAG: methylated-DNA--[protein]-cysteine S-methyltransferase [Gammaproteobacteria bacterium]|nr:methylated-DNA--[protein]-cysteine S-methyltransferase [Gammaproteobacteria bacterium]